MGIVLPDGILTNSSLQYVRDFVNGEAQILGVVSLPQTAFKRPASKGSGDSGSGVKASLLFLRKKKDDENLPKDYPIFMAIAEHIGYDATGRPDKDEFPDILNAWQEFRKKSRINFFVKAPLCFAVGRGAVEGRIDPLYLKNISVNKDIKTKYGIATLNEILVEPPQYGANERAIDGNPEIDIRYIRITDIDAFGNLKDADWKTAENVEGKYILNQNDILFARSGATAGKSFIFRRDYGKAIFAGYLIRFKIDEKKANPFYVFYYTQCKRYSEWVKSIQRPSGQPNINSEEFKSLKIPLPPREIQDKIASLMDEAYKAKRGKESEAEKLLISIETCILETLSIRILEKEEKRQKFFDVRADVMKGGRLDPFHYLPKFMSLEKALSACKYPLKTMGDILSAPIVNGLDARNFVETGTKYLRVGNIKSNEIDETDIKFVNIPIENMKKDIKLEPGDVLLTRKGTFGISAVVGDTTDYIISSEIMRLRLKEEVNPFYFSIINNISVLQEQYKQKAVGTIMGSLSQEVLKTVKILIPPRPIQDEIVKEVHEKRKEAKKLKEEAKELLEKAKKEVEEFIEKN